MNACTFGVEQSGVKDWRLSGRGAVNDHPSKVTQTFHALRNVISAEHFEDCVNALALRQFFDGLLIVSLLVVDSVLQAEFTDLSQLFIRRRSTVHFYVKYFS